MHVEERRRLIRALVRASNAFYDVLDKEGYHVYRNLWDDLENGTGTIVDESLSPAQYQGVGKLTLKWEIRKGREKSDS